MADVKAPVYDEASWLGRAMNWIDARFPLTVLWNSQVAEYYAPKNMNFAMPSPTAPRRCWCWSSRS